ncbi:MAG: CPBP family intramembrane metalloprotease [Treponema sp.]|jgi:membrane protease YdiL (CAAX protease family)|nr:CPBP family intramembrane metalloprotease [Treponema sp.]
MGPFLEPLILYCILFLPSALRHAPPAELAVFSANREITRIIAYNLPALALIWYLRRRPGQGKGASLPALKDLFAFLWAFPALVLTSLTVSLSASFFPNLPGGVKIQGPGDIIGLFVMFLSCISTGYLEESYFRHYLGRKFEELGFGPWVFILISSALFALCHIYEGPWGTMNSILAALILALVYTRFRTLHGLALAHGLYNIVVYLTSV